MVQLIMSSANKANTRVLELGTTSTTEDLQHIENTQIHKFTFLWVVQLCTLDDNCCGGKVDTPRQGCSTAKNLDEAL